MAKNNLRAMHIGCGVKYDCPSTYDYPRRGGIIGHDFATAFLNVGSSALLIAIVDGISKGPKSDGTFDDLKIGPIHTLPAGSILPHAGWRAFNLNTSALSASAADGGTSNSVTTVTMTGAATTYYVVEILSDKVSTLAFPGATTPIQLVGNPGLLAAGAIPIGRTAFLIYNTANAERTFTITNIAGDASTGIATADVKVHAVTPWALRQLAIIY